MQKFWLWLMRFAYRRAVIVTAVPDGVPTVRSMESPCPGYSPRKATLQDWQVCETDGHYLCKECCHRKPEVGLTYTDKRQLQLEEVNHG